MVQSLRFSLFRSRGLLIDRQLQPHSATTPHFSRSTVIVVQTGWKMHTALVESTSLIQSGYTNFLFKREVGICHMGEPIRC